MLGAVILLLLLVAASAILRAERLAQQVAATGQSLMQSQRLAKSVSQALVGSMSAFAEVKDSADDLSRRVQGLASGDESLKLERIGGEYDEEMAKITPLVARADASAKAVLAQLAQSASVLVKGSRFMRMERVVQAIQDPQQDEDFTHAA